MKGKKVLVLGGTGAMGLYLVPELASMGYRVDVVSLDDMASSNPNITYAKADAKDDVYLGQLLQTRYDAIVDFMIYTTAQFATRLALLLRNTDHYFFFSSYRVYADAAPITESSPRLLDVSCDQTYLANAEQEYSLYKALQEDVLRASSFRNWTILRPAITFSKFRYQLTILEANTLLYRAWRHLPVYLPEQALPVQATMNWAGDVGKLLARLVLNPAALGETFTVATAEHRTWAEIAGYYKDLIGLEYIPVDTEIFLSFYGVEHTRYQLLYDRCFDRIVDNTKLLKAVGMKQTDLTPLKEGLALELAALPKAYPWVESDISMRMTDYFNRVNA